MEEVEAILGKTFEDPKVEEIKEDEVGGSHRTFFVELDGKEVVVKIKENDWEHLPEFEKGFEIDAPVSILVKENSSVPVPEVFGFDNSGEEFGFSWMVMERIEGESLGEFLEFPENKDLYREVGELLGRLHTEITFENPGELACRDGEVRVEKKPWPELFMEIVKQFTENLEDTIFEDLKEEIGELARENIELIEDRDYSCLLHGEFAPWNLVGWEKINGVVDWERSFSGDPEYDLFVAERLFSIPRPNSGKLHEREEEIIEEFYSGYRKHRELAEGWRKRRALYRLSNLAHQMWLMDEPEEQEEYLRDRFGNVKQVLK